LSKHSILIFEGQNNLRYVVMTSKKLLLSLFGAVGLLTLIYGCQSMVFQMSDGERLYRAKCSSCHNIIEPSRHDRQTWQEYVDEYGRKITIEDKQLILQYLVGSD